MCIGIPMKVIRAAPYRALCSGDAGQCEVDTALIDGPLQAGDQLLVHNGHAIRRLAAEEAENIIRALQALRLAARGEDFIGLFADLIGREPQLPAHLRAVPDTKGGII